MRDYISGLKELPNEAKAKQLFRQMVQAVAECHAKSVIHRDIKPDNFLLKSKKDNSNGQ